MTTSTLVERLLQSAATWRWWSIGYEVGFQHGIEEGRRQANQEWTDVTTAACRAALRGWGGAEARAHRESREVA